MIICPAIVPTTELEIPEAVSESEKKTRPAAAPKSGTMVKYAVWISATPLWPALNAAAAIATIAMLTRPASERATITSRFE